MSALVWRHDRVQVVAADDSEVWTFGDAGPIRLAGRGTGALARAIDGCRDASEVVAVASRTMPREDAQRILGKWLAKGHVAESVPGPDPLLNYESVCVIGTGTACDDVQGRAALDAFVEGLARSGVEVHLGKPSCTPAFEHPRVLVVDDLLNVSENAAQHARGRFLAVQYRGSRVLVAGWLLAGSRGQCPSCLDARVRGRRPADLVAAARLGLKCPPPSRMLHRSAPQLAAGLVAARILDAQDAEVSGAAGDAEITEPAFLLVASLQTAVVERHHIAPVAGCAQCDPHGPVVRATHLAEGGSPAAGGRTSDRAPSAVLGEQGAGGFRVVDPTQTWQRYSHLISDVVGVVPHVVQTGPAELRAFSAGGNVAAHDDLVLLRSLLRSSSGGKGITLDAARTGALAEALERHSLRATGAEPHLRARLADLPGPALLPNEIQLFSERQLNRVEQLAAMGISEPIAGKGFHRVPRRFDSSAEHDWSPVVRWRTGEVVWLPSSMVWLGWPGTPEGYPSGSSNGAAAGNTVEEALLQGLLELVERDSVALWWHPRCRRPAFDLGSWNDPRIDAALASQRSLGSEVWVLDVTSDVGIPAAVAVATGWSNLTEAPLLGFGAHVDPALAVVRALTELAQAQAPIIAFGGDMLRAEMGASEAAWFTEVTVASEPWLGPHGLVGPPSTPAYSSLDEAIDDVVARLEARGLEVLWADCSRPDYGLPVVRTWAPGLRHFWNRYAPGRLYDVPPQLQWCPPGYTEVDLNPRPMIL